MKTAVVVVLGLSAGIALGALVPACGGECRAAPSAGARPSASAKPTGPDYTNLVVPVADISAVSPEPFSVAKPPSPTVGSPGAQASFTNSTGARVINLNVFVLPDAPAAVNAMNATLGSVGGVVVGGDPQPISVGDGGTLIAGIAPDNSKTVTVVAFTEGKASVTLQFEGPPDDAVPVDFATAVAQAQADTIKKNLPA
jgi:hypothetical protein